MRVTHQLDRCNRPKHKCILNMSLNIRALSPELQEKAKQELNEVPDRIADDVAKIREWVSKQPHLKCRTDDQTLVNFLRGSKYSLERTKEKLDLFYTVRTAMPEMFKGRSPLCEKSLELIRSGMLVPLPNTTTPDGPRAILIRPGVYDPAKVSINDVFRVNSLFMDIMQLEDDNLIVAGQTGIIDLSNCTMGHFLQMSPAMVKRITVLSQDASPFRLKGFNYVHTPSGFEMVFNLFKKFLNEKNRSRVSDILLIIFR